MLVDELKTGDLISFSVEGEAAKFINELITDVSASRVYFSWGSVPKSQIKSFEAERSANFHIKVV